MNEQPNSSTVQDVAIQLEIISENDQIEDIADIDEVARSIVDHIRSSGYIVKPTYTGKMGGPVFDIIMQTYTVLQDNRELIGTSASLLEIINVTLELIKGHIERHKQGGAQLALAPTIIEVTIPTINGPWTIKAPDVETAIKVVKQLPVTESKKVNTITSQNGSKIKTNVARKRHNR